MYSLRSFVRPAQGSMSIARWFATAISFFCVGPADAITLSAFGSAGEGGSANGQTLLVGAGGSVFELDAFISVDSGEGIQTSLDPLPTGVSLGFSWSLSSDSSDLLLDYRIENRGSSPLGSIRFTSFMDAEIDESLNGFFNESAISSGDLASGQGFEIDDPFAGDLFGNLLSGTVDDTNAFESSFGDVSMALSFDLGGLGPSELAQIQILISEDGDSLGTFSIEQFDEDPRSPTRITFSGAATSVAPIPEPNATALFAIGIVVVKFALSRRRHPL